MINSYFLTSVTIKYLNTKKRTIKLSLINNDFSMRRYVIGFCGKETSKRKEDADYFLLAKINDGNRGTNEWELPTGEMLENEKPEAAIRRVWREKFGEVNIIESNKVKHTFRLVINNRITEFVPFVIISSGNEALNKEWYYELKWLLMDSALKIDLSKPSIYYVAFMNGIYFNKG